MVQPKPGSKIFGPPMRGGVSFLRGGVPPFEGGGRNFLPSEMRGGRAGVVDLYVNQSVKRRARYDRTSRMDVDFAVGEEQSLTPSAVQVSGCWSIPARYASNRRVPTGILRVSAQPEMAQLVGRCPHLVAHFSPCAPRLCFDRRQLSNPWRIGISHRAVPALHSATLIAGAKLALAVLSRQQSGSGGRVNPTTNREPSSAGQ
jgi:hypothetical protein